MELLTTNPFEPLLSGRGLVVLDGGLATELEERGHVLDSHLWSARLLTEAPEEIRAVHMAYLDAGADCVTSASYQASFAGLGASGLSEDECEEVIRRSSALAIEARDDFWHRRTEDSSRSFPIVAASVGPYGAYLADGSEYDGRYGIDAAALDDFHRRRFGVLATSGVDVLACETIPSMAEARVLLEILADHPSTWIWMSFSCRDGEHLRDGSPFEAAARLCGESDRVAAVGVNCTEPGFLAELMRRARDVTDLPLIAYPNSGEAYDAVTKRWLGSSSDERWLEGVRTAVDAGARVVGGCCRIGPELITVLRDRIESGTWSPEAWIELEG